MINSCISLFLTLTALLAFSSSGHAFKPLACCPVGPLNSHVINTDQAVIMLWDKEKQTQHFIRRANFKTDAKDIGFIVPSPSRPQLEESGDAAFEGLAHITAPTAPRNQGGNFGCAAAPKAALANGAVVVVEQKRVAGYDATVLTAQSGDDLVEWLKDNGYPYSPAVAAWAKPYLGGDWHFTALKLVKGEEAKEDMAASALRISFKTDKPLFPYREPESATASKALNNKFRLLRIYFIAEAQYEGKINGQQWSGKTRWSGDITEHRARLMKALKLPANTGPDKLWLTEIEDQWPYEQAAGDVYFTPVAKQMVINRDGLNVPLKLDAMLLVLLGAGLLLGFRKRI